jgi:GrpB-like predicted nucleotidyltransferase (UPF0157 family)
MTDVRITGGPIGVYEYLSYDDPAQIVRPWDPRTTEVAGKVAALIESQMADARVEHVGSTAIPGCAGKGIVDLQLLYPAGRLAAARDTLAGLGFQRQTGRDPFPEERPLRVGMIEHDGTTFRLHVHVIAADDAEAAELRAFRDRLRADPALMEEYVASKQAAFANGPSDNIAYNRTKEPFIKRVIASLPDTP